MLKANIVLVSDTSEDSIAITLSASVSKPATTAITNSTVAAITSDGGRRETIAADVVFDPITNLT